MARVGAAHEAVTGDLGDDRGGGDRRALAVAVDHGAALVAVHLADREAVAEQDAPRTGDLQQRFAQRGQVGLVQAAVVDAARTPRDDRDARGDAQHHRVQRLARLLGVLLGVVEQPERANLARAEALVVEEDRGGDQRAGQTAPAGLVGPGDEAEAEGAVMLDELAPRAALGLLTRRGHALGRDLRLGLGLARGPGNGPRELVPEAGRPVLPHGVRARGGRSAWAASRSRRPRR
jgi:hypothetical protein